MNFYDKVHELVRSLRETEEYKNYISIKKQLNDQEKEVYAMLKDFKEKQQKQQIAYMNTGTVDEEIKKDLENMYSILIQNEKVRTILETEIKIDVMLVDMQKIVGEGIKDILEF